MNRKLRHTASALMFMLFVLAFLTSFPLVSHGSPDPEIAIVEYDYYVVAGRNMDPTLPDPDDQPSGFTFTCVANNNATSTGYNFGNLNYEFGRGYLYMGAFETGSAYNDNAYVTVTITNNLGYDVEIVDLSGEVTSGTSWEPHYEFGSYFANFTILILDTIDQWDDRLEWGHEAIIDECNYNTGVVNVHRDAPAYADWTMHAVGAPRPDATVGPWTLLEDDPDGDALTTGHVAPQYNSSASPIILADGADFTEYFGLTLWGKISSGKQVDGTVTLRLKYKPVPAIIVPETTPDGYLESAYLTFQVNESCQEAVFPVWKAAAKCNVNVSLLNMGNELINATVNAYYIQVQYGFPQIPDPSNPNWTLIGTESASDLPPCLNSTDLGILWDVNAHSLTEGVYLVKANATFTNGTITDTDQGYPNEFFTVMRVRTIGNADGNNKVDVIDQRVVQLAMFSQWPDETYEEFNTPGAPPYFTDFDGNGRIDVLDQRLQQLNMFALDQTGYNIWLTP